VARVLWRDAQGKEGSIDLGAGETRIGRAVDCPIRTDDAMVSRHHARIVWGGGGFVIEDLGSANGVYYQEQKVQTHLLRHGDAVRCGSLWLRFIDTAQLEQAAQQQPPQAIVNPPQPINYGVQPVPPPGPLPPTGYGMQPAGQQVPPPVMPVSPSGGMAPLPSAGASGSAIPNPVMGGSGAAGGGDQDEEIKRLRRRVEQLQAELRVYRGGKMGADKARKLEDLESDFAQIEEERNQLKAQLGEMEQRFASEGGSVKVQRAASIRDKAAETVTALNDLLSSLRINVMAAEGEFDQFANTMPRASFELIREAMRSSATDVETARELLRQLREIAG
jgi:FHA domain-containing protein